MSRVKVRSGDYELYVEGVSCAYPTDDTMVRFWTKWNSAKDPSDMQRKFEMTFKVEELDQLIDVLADIRDAAVVRTAVHQPVAE